MGIAALIRGLRAAVTIVQVGGELAAEAFRAWRGVKQANDAAPEAPASREKIIGQASGPAGYSESLNAGRPAKK